MDIVLYLALLFSAILSGLIYFILPGKNSKHRLKLLLAFSGAYLFGISLMHLIPEVYASGDHQIGAYVLIGFFIQIILEYASEGIEHGHIHIHKDSHNHAKFPFAVMVGLCVHSLLEGMPLGVPHAEDSTVHSLLGGIVLHHAPVAFALMSMLMDSGISKTKAIFMLVIFSLMAPLGGGITQFLSENMLANIGDHVDKIMAIVIGIFLHISTTILFESNEDHKFNRLKLGVIVAGAVLAVIG